MGVDILITFIAILLCLLLSAFFSSSETAITAVSRARIYHLVMEGNKRARSVSELRKHKELLIGGIMIGNNTVNILGSALATDIAIHAFGSNGVMIATVLMTLVVVIFGEVLPKTYAIQNAESLSLKIAPAITFILYLLRPLNMGLQFIVKKILARLGMDSSATENLFSATDVIRGTIELHHHEGEVVKQDRDMLGSILDMHEVLVGEIMIHRLAMQTIDIELPPEKIIALAVASPHSRIPLWRGEQDNIVGVLHVKTLIKQLREATAAVTHAQIERLLVKPWFIPETTTIKHQLHAFRKERQHLALVIDEYGVLQGLVTLEDIIEEIVGRIDDEHDRHVTHDIVHAGQDTYFVQGSVTIRDLNREMSWNLPDEEASTIAGLVMHEAQMIPDIGQQIEFNQMRFTILDKQGNQITRIQIEKLRTDLPPLSAQ